MKRNEPPDEIQMVKTSESQQDLKACREENGRLKDLVVKLTELVIKRVYRDERK